MTSQSIRLILADDHVLVRKAMKSLLEGLGGIEVVGEAADGREALRLIHAAKPDLVLMDIAMPKLNGLDATARAVRQRPGLRVIILSMHASQRYVIEAMRAGACGYLLKTCEVEELNQAVRTVAGGEKYLTPAISDAIVAAILEAGSGPETAACPLTSRQREILQLVAEGRTSRDIAQSLNLSPKTVEAHRAEIMTRLNIHDVAGLVRYAIRLGLADPEV